MTNEQFFIFWVVAIAIILLIKIALSDRTSPRPDSAPPGKSSLPPE